MGFKQAATPPLNLFDDSMLVTPFSTCAVLSQVEKQSGLHLPDMARSLQFTNLYITSSKRISSGFLLTSEQN